MRTRMMMMMIVERVMMWISEVWWTYDDQHHYHHSFEVYLPLLFSSVWVVDVWELLRHQHRQSMMLKEVIVLGEMVKMWTMMMMMSMLLLMLLCDDPYLPMVGMGSWSEFSPESMDDWTRKMRCCLMMMFES